MWEELNDYFAKIFNDAFSHHNIPNIAIYELECGRTINFNIESGSKVWGYPKEPIEFGGSELDNKFISYNGSISTIRCMYGNVITRESIANGIDPKVSLNYLKIMVSNCGDRLGKLYKTIYNGFSRDHIILQPYHVLRKVPTISIHPIDERDAIGVFFRVNSGFAVIGKEYSYGRGILEEEI